MHFRIFIPVHVFQFVCIWLHKYFMICKCIVSVLISFYLFQIKIVSWCVCVWCSILQWNPLNLLSIEWIRWSTDMIFKPKFSFILLFHIYLLFSFLVSFAFLFLFFFLLFSPFFTLIFICSKDLNSIRHNLDTSSILFQNCMNYIVASIQHPMQHPEWNRKIIP